MGGAWPYMTGESWDGEAIFSVTCYYIGNRRRHTRGIQYGKGYNSIPLPPRRRYSYQGVNITWPLGYSYEGAILDCPRWVNSNKRTILQSSIKIGKLSGQKWDQGSDIGYIYPIMTHSHKQIPCPGRGPVPKIDTVAIYRCVQCASLMVQL